MGTKVQALQQWCKKQTDGYRDVDVVNMTSSWKSGMAFCAIIHRYRPDLIDYDALSKENVLENNSLAFEVADKELGIPALLDAPDMVAIRVPDKLSVVTYVSQYYNFFHNKPQLGGPGVKKSVKRHQNEDKSGPEAKRQTLNAVNESPIKEKQVSMGDKCGICKDKVYLMERHIEKGKLYHRACFRKSELSPTAKMITKVEHEQQETKEAKKPDFWRRRADAKKSEQVKKEEIKDESQEKQEKSRTTKAKSLNFLDHSNDENKSKFKDKRHEEKMDVSYSNGHLKDDMVKDDKNSHRPVPKARNITSPTESPAMSKTSSNEPEKRSSVPKFEFKSKIVSSAPKACVVSKVDMDTAKPQPAVRHSAPVKPSRLSEATQLPGDSESPPPLPKNQPPNMLSTTNKESALSNNTKPSGLHLKTSPKQDRLSKLLAKDSTSSEDKVKDVSAKQRDSESSIFSHNSKHDSHGLKHSSAFKSKDGGNEKSVADKDTEPVAVLMSPSSPEPHDPKVLGGLLKNLANIRQRKDSEDEVNKTVTSPNSKGKQKKIFDWQTNKSTAENRKEVKSLDSTEAREKADQRAEKAKSVDFLSGKKPFVSDKKEHEKPKIKTDLTISDEEPAWKKALEERKKKRDERPKSADLLSEKKDENTRRVVSMDVPKEKDERPAWQIEAEKRKAARQGGYVDPEKAKLEKGETKDNSNEKTAGGVAKQLILPSSIAKEEPKLSEPEKKKISVGKKFDFKLFDNEHEKKVKEKPPRPPPMSPTSGLKSHHGLSSVVSNKLASTKKMSAPSPPRPSRSRSEIKTFGDMKRLSPQEIQQQLSDIDHRLTDLEIRGRQLEESIRKDHEEEDEGLMIEWFTLVNDKNELVRTEADLIYISRAQELEDEQQRIDRELRELLDKPEDQKTDEDKEQEEHLLQQLVDLVNQRSLIVDCQDEDRIRYEEEDRDIAEILAKKEFCRKNSEVEDSKEETKIKSKEERKAEKKKKKKNKKEKKSKKEDH